MPKQTLTRLAYQTLQQGRSLAGVLHKGLSTRLMEVYAPEAMPNTKQISRELLIELRNSISALEKIDWKEAEEGIYPISQLFDSPWIKWAARYPLIWFDLPSTWKRRQEKKTSDLPDHIDPDKYPRYYLQNFHHQTDGYLSGRSADLYDLQVEILFNGTADSMRRRIIAPLKKGLNTFGQRNQSSLRVLDIATGTGRALHQIRRSLPEIELLGIDLSSEYLQHANSELNNRRGGLTQLIRGNAEKMSFESESFQGATCVFLLHELPAKARQNVLNEAWRILEDGGVFVLADSIQEADSPQFSSVMEDFPKTFHEPYYKDYIKDDITKRLELSGFDVIKEESHFMTHVWTAYKPKRKS